MGGWSAFVLITAATVLAGPRQSQGRDGAAAAVSLSVAGKVPKPLKLGAAEIARLPRQTVRVREQDGKEVEFEGVTLAVVLEAAGLSLTPDELRGPALEHYLVVEAADGYRVVFALPELAPAFTDRVVLLADRRAGKPLGANEGPLRLLVPGEKRHARWVRQVTGLKVERD